MLNDLDSRKKKGRGEGEEEFLRYALGFWGVLQHDLIANNIKPTGRGAAKSEEQRAKSKKHEGNQQPTKRVE